MSEIGQIFFPEHRILKPELRFDLKKERISAISCGLFSLGHGVGRGPIEKPARISM